MLIDKIIQNRVSTLYFVSSLVTLNNVFSISVKLCGVYNCAKCVDVSIYREIFACLFVVFTTFYHVYRVLIPLLYFLVCTCMIEIFYVNFRFYYRELGLLYSSQKC
mgnify:CR=1 FL=1